MQEGQHTPVYNAHDEFLGLEDAIRTAVQLANAIRMMTMYGQEIEEGLNRSNLESLAQVNYDLIDALGKIEDTFDRVYSTTTGERK